MIAEAVVGYRFGVKKYCCRNAPYCISDEWHFESLIFAPRCLGDFADDCASRPHGGGVCRRVGGIDVADGKAAHQLSLFLVLFRL
jgi:hypothetical protein